MGFLDEMQASLDRTASDANRALQVNRIKSQMNDALNAASSLPASWVPACTRRPRTTSSCVRAARSFLTASPQSTTSVLSSRPRSTSSSAKRRRWPMLPHSSIVRFATTACSSPSCFARVAVSRWPRSRPSWLARPRRPPRRPRLRLLLPMVRPYAPRAARPSRRVTPSA